MGVEKNDYLLLEHQRENRYGRNHEQLLEHVLAPDLVQSIRRSIGGRRGENDQLANRDRGEVERERAEYKGGEERGEGKLETAG